MIRFAIAALLVMSGAQAAHPVDDGMASFFAGRWSGAGAFANGKPIEADVIFERDLDGYWLSYRHTDRAPNRFKALGMWGYEAGSDKLVMTLNDNFGNARRFTSDGWDGEHVVFLHPDPKRNERFRFDRVDQTHFRMTYEVSADGQAWRLGDTLLFEKM